MDSMVIMSKYNLKKLNREQLDIIYKYQNVFNKVALFIICIFMILSISACFNDYLIFKVLQLFSSISIIGIVLISFIYRKKCINKILLIDREEKNKSI